MTKIPILEEDLLILARRGQLSREQEQLLESALAESSDLQWLMEAGLQFDKESTPQAGDDDILARMAGGAVASHSRRLHPRRRAGRATVLGLGFLFASSAAAAGWTAISTYRNASSSESTPKAADEVVAPASGLLKAKRPGRAPSVIELHEQELPVESTKAADDLPVLPSKPEASPLSVGTSADGPRPQAKTTLVTSPSVASKERPLSEGPPPTLALTPSPSDGSFTQVSATVLFATANAERRAGRAARSLELYQQLARQFPHSQETRAAQLPLAELLLRSGRAQEAFKNFESYDGPLRPEALWGATRALRALGRHEEEARLLRRLIEQHPKSAYVRAAEVRLSSLVAPPSVDARP